jgi:hypothetical protein
MSIECTVFRPGQGSPETYRFVAVPRVGEGITLPGHYDNFVVESVDHMAREIEDRNPPMVQMHLLRAGGERRPGSLARGGASVRSE